MDEGMYVKMDCECCRELTFGEEIESLPISSDIKDRMIEKFNRMTTEHEELITNLRNCNSEIDELEKAVVYLSKLLVVKPRNIY